MSEVHYDPEFGATVLNETEVVTSEAFMALQQQAPELAALSRWGASLKNRKSGIFERDRYVTPDGVFEQMKTAQDAAESDDIVSGVMESTEALAFGGVRIESDEEDEENILNQISDDIDLDARFREMWRELFQVSQVTVAVWWGNKSYKVKGRNPKTNVKRKQEFSSIKVPRAISILDPLKVIPVGSFLFGQEKLAWVANKDEARQIDRHLQQGAISDDEVIQKLVVGKYNPDDEERQRIEQFGFNSANLYELNPKMVFRHTLTRPSYKPFSDVRLKSVFELLDMKHLLREMDRSHVLGATNFIVLIRKGTDNIPAKQAEITQLQSQVRVLSRVPVIVGDHRLSIEIITPKLDVTLNEEKYNVLDSRIAGRLYQMFMTGSSSAGTRGDDSLKLARVVARGLESRRQMMKKGIERKIIDRIIEENDRFTEEAKIVFSPAQISLDFDPAQLVFMLDLLDRNHTARSTVLEQIGLDEDEEARKIDRAQKYDDIFNSLTPLNDPQETADIQKDTMKLQQKLEMEKMDKVQEKMLAAPAPEAPDGGGGDPRSSGRNKGGNKNGGGAAPGSGQGQERDPRRKAKPDKPSKRSGD